jgi:hypothetical protein
MDRKASVKRKLITVSAILIGLFLLVNIVWYVWRNITYSQYIKAMTPNSYSSIIVPRYYLRDSDGYDFNVKYPDYLSFTGNLGVGIPSIDENLFTDALMIWPKMGGGYEYGALLYEGDNGYQVYIDANGNAIDKVFDEVVARHRDNIESLLIKADVMWDIIE